MKRVVSHASDVFASLRLAVWFAFMAAFTAAAAEKEAEKPTAKEAKPAAADTNDWVYVDNGSVKLGVRRSSGAGIGWISESGSNRNLVNHFDRGRLIQQSYYGKEDGSIWDKQPWRWNPVQGGDWKGNPATILEFKTTTNSVYAKSIARHWASGTNLTDVVFEEWITIGDRFVLVHFKMTYTGTESHPVCDQEVPAIFLAPDLDTLVLYDGDKPWTDAPLSRSKPGWPNEAKNITENWAAYVDKNDFGLAAYVPKIKVLTCYRFGNGKAESGACSYFAPVTQFAFTPGKVHEYEVFLKVGTVKEMRDFISIVHKALSGKPPSFGPEKK